MGGLQAVSGYIKGGNYSPVPVDSSAWVMLHDRWVSSGRYAQDGWVKRNTDSSYIVFAEWNSVDNEMFWVSGPQFSHTHTRWTRSRTTRSSSGMTDPLGLRPRVIKVGGQTKPNTSRRVMTRRPISREASGMK